MKLKFNILPLMRTLKLKIFILTPISVVLSVLIWIYAEETMGAFLFFIIIGTFFLTEKEWEYVRTGVEYFQISDQSIEVKKFTYNSPKVRSGLKNIQVLQIDDDSFRFKLNGKKYWLRRDLLIEGDWGCLKKSVDL